MTIEEKTLLVKDLSARLPYYVRIREYNDEYGWHDGVLSTITNDYFSKGEPSIEGDWINRVEDVKPYLRPLYSMSEEEKSYFHNFKYWILKGDVEHCTINMVDWLNAHHFDFRGLIEKGLAVEAPEGMYNGFQRHDL